jgi:hypothetical protein
LRAFFRQILRENLQKNQQTRTQFKKGFLGPNPRSQAPQKIAESS